MKREKKTGFSLLKSTLLAFGVMGFVSAFSPGVISGAQAATIWNESMDGDLSNSFSTPTYIGALGVGNFDVYGTMASNDEDVFNWTLDGSELVSVTLIQWDTSHPNSSFYFDGTNALLPPAKDASDFSRFILNPGLIGSPLFDLRGIDKSGSEFSIATLVGNAEVEYGFRIKTTALSVVPLPAGLPLYGAGLALMGFLGWRRKRKAASSI